MGIGFALGAGFFNRGVQTQDENRQREAEDRRFYMQNWVNDTLPKIRQQRAVEEQGVRSMNDIMAADPRARDNPALAYYASKSVLSGVYKSPQEALDEFEKNPQALPPELLKRQQEILSETFAYDIDQTTGKAANFRLKDQGPQGGPIPGSDRKRSLSEIFTGKRSAASTLEGARKDVISATGVDPTQSSDINRFMSGKTPELGVKPVDKEKKEFEKFAIKSGLESSKLKNMGSALQALSKGPDEALKFLSNPGAFYTKEELDSDEFRGNIQNALVKDFMDNGTNYPEGAAQLISGKLAGPALVEYMQRGMKTPEEKAQFSLDNLVKQGLLTPSGTLDWVATLNSPAAVAAIFKDEKTRAAAVASMKKAIADSQSQDIIQRLIQSGALGGIPGGSGTSTGAGTKGQSAQPPVETEAPGRGFTIGKAVREGYNPSPGQQEKNKATPSAARLGETQDGTPVVGKKLIDAVQKGSVEDIESASPYGVLEALTGPVLRESGMDIRKDPRTKAIVSAITMSGTDMNLLMAGKAPAVFAQNLSTLADIHLAKVDAGEDGVFPAYESSEEAIADLPAGKFFIDKSDDMIKIVTEADKEALEASE